MKRKVPALIDIEDYIEKSYGPDDKRVVVLGSFDTSPYMDFVCRRLAELNCTAFTSRYTYKMFRRRGRRYIGRADNFDLLDKMKKKKPLVAYLRSMIDKAEKCVVVFSVPGSHYIETDWLSTVGFQDVLGIAFVRSIKGSDCSMELEDYGCSICIGKGMAWECMTKEDSCVFQKQGIAKDVIERFTMQPNRMKLVAIENLDRVKVTLNAWLLGKLRRKSQQR